jgi:hypothetical protein
MENSFESFEREANESTMEADFPVDAAMTDKPESTGTSGQCCAQCGALFVCAMQAGLAECWCAKLPPIVPPLGLDAGCLCPDCLAEAIRRAQAGGAG